MRHGIKDALVLFLFLVISLSVVYMALAVTTPEGPGTFTEFNASRRTAVGPYLRAVYAGNVTGITITATTMTQAWAGFYGNITGTITLDDANNNTMYDWAVASPEGEIYASEATAIDWTTGNVRCWNYSRGLNATFLSFTEYQDYTGGDAVSDPVYTAGGMVINITDYDSVNRTFKVNQTHKSFYVGGWLIDGSTAQKADPASPSSTGSGCPAAFIYDTTEAESLYFQEVLLYSDVQSRPIFTALIEPTTPEGFNNANWDFEMLVAENGHKGDIATTNYYFYVELS
ncbi:MAG: hypothetical protein V1735_04055 [Nanoarchaeota archaeon]